jgi:hypothetical protein
MGNSTISLGSMYDSLAARGIADPRKGASGYGDKLALEMANSVIADLICDRFNWKWNRAVAAAIYTNSWQQDYPQPRQAAGLIGWGEDCAGININNTALPKPLTNIKWRRGLSRTSISTWLTQNICWMYNGDLTLGAWPGAGMVYSPLVGTGPQAQNPLMSMMDANANILIVTGFGTTGSVAPFAAVNAAEGVTVTDGTVTWTVVLASSQGFRVDNLPSATGPTWQITPVFQIEPPTFTSMQQKLDPIPDSFARYFRRGLESECLQASPNPGDMKRGQQMRAEWQMALIESKKQGDREPNAYSLLPAGSVVESRLGYNGDRGPYTADNPY